MKYIPLHYRESTKDWFGKRGISNHIDCVFLQDPEDSTKIKKFKYYTIIDKVNQDGAAVLCTNQHVLQQIQQDFTHIKTINDHSNNAAYYSSAAVILGKAKLAKELGFLLENTEFNEPQKGKDQCDRDAAVIKRYIKSYWHSGPDVSDAAQMYEAVLYAGGVRNVKLSVIEVNCNYSDLEKVSVQGIQSFHSVKFDDEGVHFWKYHKIGSEVVKLFDLDNFSCHPSYTVIKEFPKAFPSGKAARKNSHHLQRKHHLCQFFALKIHAQQCFQQWKIWISIYQVGFIVEQRSQAVIKSKLDLPNE